jgi:hypothetical protein
MSLSVFDLGIVTHKDDVRRLHCVTIPLLQHLLRGKLLVQRSLGFECVSGAEEKQQLRCLSTARAKHSKACIEVPGVFLSICIMSLGWCDIKPTHESVSLKT